MSKVNFGEKLSKFSEQWTPKVIAEMNDYQFKLVKIEGEFVWHEHPGHGRGLHRHRGQHEDRLRRWFFGGT